jgi:hypothetical protein
VTRLSWFTNRTGINWPRVLFVALSCTVILALGIVGATSATVFGPYNPSWDGASDLREQITTDTDIDSEFVSETSRYDEVDQERTIAFVIAPEQSYSEAESDRVRQFVESGGTLVVLENFGQSGNELLGDIGAQARVDGRLLRDERNNFQAPTMPIATGVENHTLTTDVDQLTLNYATSVQPRNATVLARTSEFAYLVEDEDEELTDDDELAAYPVATIEDIGSGRVIVVGDPSITINAMLEQPDNALFLTNLYRESDRVVFDVSHSEGLPPLTSAVLLIRESPVAQIVIGGVGIFGLALLSGRRLRPGVWRALGVLPYLNTSWLGVDSQRQERPIMSDAERAAYLRRQYPDWDEDRIERVITALNKTDSKGDDNIDE